MSSAEEQRRLSDIANAAAILAEAIGAIDGRGMETVDSEVGGRADVILDDDAADVVLHRRGVTVHVRRDGGGDPEGRGR